MHIQESSWNYSIRGSRQFRMICQILIRIKTNNLLQLRTLKAVLVEGANIMAAR